MTATVEVLAAMMVMAAPMMMMMMIEMIMIKVVVLVAITMAMFMAVCTVRVGFMPMICRGTVPAVGASGKKEDGKVMGKRRHDIQGTRSVT